MVSGHRKPADGFSRPDTGLSGNPGTARLQPGLLRVLCVLRGMKHYVSAHSSQLKNGMRSGSQKNRELSDAVWPGFAECERSRQRFEKAVKIDRKSAERRAYYVKTRQRQGARQERKHDMTTQAPSFGLAAASIGHEVWSACSSRDHGVALLLRGIFGRGRLAKSPGTLSPSFICEARRKFCETSALLA
jgi:hypothetical protein